MKDLYTIGLDFGTENVRAVLVNVFTGEVVSSTYETYCNGVIERVLPNSEVYLPPDFALQDPSDWLISMKNAILQLIHNYPVSRQNIIGLGIDFTACTLLPTTFTGKPLCQETKFRLNPHSWVKLWKHHSAQPQADLINLTAYQLNEEWINYFGGKISSEWVLAKALEVYQKAPDIYNAAALFLEGADWVVWQLTGNFMRNSCAAGYKANWHKVNGYPSREFLEAVQSGFGGFFKEKFFGEVVVPGTYAGMLSPKWSEDLGLPAGISVAAGIIDAHAAVLGAGVTNTNELYMIMGTSTCHMLLHEKEILVPGISGVVEDGIIPGLFGYEAGQAGVGDIFAWFVNSSVPPTYHLDANNRGISLHDLLSEKAGTMKAGESGLLALDWWNGCRTPLVNANLSGLLLGMNLLTTPEEIYRALIESTAFGTRLIIDNFEAKGIYINHIIAGGGLTKNQFLMQVYADVTEHKIGVSNVTNVSSVGAAMLGSVAAGESRGGYKNIKDAAIHMKATVTTDYCPQPDILPTYRQLYSTYKNLVNYFGGHNNQIMYTLNQIRQKNIN